MNKETILILGVTGMLGHTLFKEMSEIDNFKVYGTARSKIGLNKFFSNDELGMIIDDVNGNNYDTILRAITISKPTYIINCIGIIKQLDISNDYLTSITINSLLPHKIALFAEVTNAKLIHISTDCVFDGYNGNYTENDNSNAKDLYGKSKFLGEVINNKNALTIRTSIIGHELKTSLSLIDWFLSQKGSVKGFSKAIYSGFPTIEIADIIINYIIPNKNLFGLYHISSKPIDKYTLLNLVKDIYNKDIKINKDIDFTTDKSLNSEKFKKCTGYNPPSWEKLVEKMHQQYIKYGFYKDKF